jgi:uncharacterized protein (DUF2235 family)
MKRLVLCCDGTWNKPDQERDGKPCPTNVVKLAVRIAKRDGAIPQITYYDQGIGTGNLIDHYTGGAFGDGLEDNIHSSYLFLMANYELGDEIFLFGFSRGAFTARSLAGMIRKCGILRRELADRYHEATLLYRSQDHPDDPCPVKFREDFSLNGGDSITIKLIGVWDTVGALGIPLRGLRWLTRKDYQFHDTALSRSVEFAYHALAIDEHRAPFEPTLWASAPKTGQTLEQVWFCGSHGDVGGGTTEPGLSDIALDWMITKATGAGLVFDEAAAQAFPLHLNPRGTLHESRTGIYRLTPGLDRPVGKVARDPKQLGDSDKKDDPTQSVHDSVRERWDSDPTYRPVPLGDYFRRTGDPRGKA